MPETSGPNFLKCALTDGHARFTGEGKQQKIVYIAVNHTERFSDPEEQVRAEFWAELIYRYGYEPARIGVEVVVPDRTPSDRADLVVFRDDERKKPYAVATLTPLQANMQARRDRRNNFFHSTHLLDLNVNRRICVEAFCDLFDYGELLFGIDWRLLVQSTYNLETLEILLELEKKSFSDPSVWPKVDAIIKKWPRNVPNAARTGVHMTVHPEDLHLRLTVIYGHKELRDKLVTLLQ